MFMLKRMLISFASVIWLLSMGAHTLSPDSLYYEAETHATFSGGENTPFWLMNNLQGLGSPEKNNGYVRGAIHKNHNKGKQFSWGAGVDLVGSWRAQSPFYIHQLYGEIKYRCLDAMIGSKVIPGEFNDPRLSSGNLLYSGNALPIPQIRAGIFDYADFWGTNGWFAVKGYVSYGCFTDSRWQKSWSIPGAKRTEDVLYHSKGIWLRGGKTSVFPLQGEIGIEMASQFGGKSFSNGLVLDMPNGIKDFLKAFFPIYGDAKNFLGTTSSIEGNMLGAYNIALSWFPNADWSIKAYYEHYFEDQSQMTFEYGWKDGLWGIEAQLPKNPFVSTVVMEYLYTKDQTGSVNHDASETIPEQVSGRDNYYSNSVYQGWCHWGMGIGNPLMLSPIYNPEHELLFKDTRIKAWHIGIAGNPSPDLSYRILLSYSQNWGTYTLPLPEVLDNFNFLAEVSWRPSYLKGWHASLGIAADSGNLLGKSFGVALTIGKTGGFSLQRKKRRK